MLKNENAINLEPAHCNCQLCEKLNKFLTCSFTAFHLFYFFTLFIFTSSEVIETCKISCHFDNWKNSLIGYQALNVIEIQY